jgi:predicted transcriptional regulator
MARKYPLSREQLDLIERFIAAQNAIEHYLRDYFETSHHLPYTRMVRQYARRNPSWRDEETLIKYAQLRNVIVHEKVEAYRYLSVPVLLVVEEIEEIRDRLLNPERIYPQFKVDVMTIQLSTSLSEVLKLISKHHFSQFPIYEAHKFCGLLTENGITHWLADHIVETMSLVELADERVEAVLQNEEARANYEFVARDTLVDEVVAKFSDNIFLEAVLISHSGKTSQKLLGMITRWDILSQARGNELLDEV